MMHVKPEKPDSHDSLDYKGSSRIPSGPRKVPTGPAPGQTFEDWLSDDEDGFNPFCQDHLDKEDAPPKDDEWDLFLSCILVKQETKLPMPIHVSVRQYEQPMRIMVSQHYGDKLVPGKCRQFSPLSCQYLYFACPPNDVLYLHAYQTCPAICQRGVSILATWAYLNNQQLSCKHSQSCAMVATVPVCCTSVLSWLWYIYAPNMQYICPHLSFV